MTNGKHAITSDQSHLVLVPKLQLGNPLAAQLRLATRDSRRVTVAGRSAPEEARRALLPDEPGNRAMNYRAVPPLVFASLLYLAASGSAGAQASDLSLPEIRDAISRRFEALQTLSATAAMAVDGRPFATYDIALAPERLRVFEVSATATAVSGGAAVQLEGPLEQRLIITPGQVLRFHPTRLQDGGLVAASIVERSGDRASEDAKLTDWRLLGSIPIQLGGLYRRSVADILSLPDADLEELTWEGAQPRTAVCRLVRSSRQQELVVRIVPEWHAFVTEAVLSSRGGASAMRVRSTPPADVAAGIRLPREVQFEILANGQTTYSEVFQLQDVEINAALDDREFSVAALGLPKGHPVKISPGRGQPLQNAVWMGDQLAMLGDAPLQLPGAETLIRSPGPRWRLWLIIVNLLVGGGLLLAWGLRRKRGQGRT